jgi:serine/threonine-protein kinase
MLTGRMPYTAETPMAVILKHLQDPIPHVSEFQGGLPEDVDDILIKAMAKQPEQRYQTAGELAEALIRVAGPGALTATPTMLRQAARASIEEIQADRDQRKDEIDVTMATFAKQRSASKAAAASMATEVIEDGPTVRTPTSQPVAQPPVPAARSRTPLVGWWLVRFWWR